MVDHLQILESEPKPGNLDLPKTCCFCLPDCSVGARVGSFFFPPVFGRFPKFSKMAGNRSKRKGDKQGFTRILVPAGSGKISPAFFLVSEVLLVDPANSRKFCGPLRTVLASCAATEAP